MMHLAVPDGQTVEWVTATMLVSASAAIGVATMFVQFWKERIDRYVELTGRLFQWLFAKDKTKVKDLPYWHMETKFQVYWVLVVFYNLGLVLLGTWTQAQFILAFIGVTLLTLAALRDYESKAAEGGQRALAQAAAQGAALRAQFAQMAGPPPPAPPEPVPPPWEPPPDPPDTGSVE